MNGIAMVAKAVARKVKGGGNEAEARARIGALMVAHQGDNLVHALVYEGFAGEAAAEKLAAWAGAVQAEIAA